MRACRSMGYEQGLDVNSKFSYESRFYATSYASVYDVELPSTGLDWVLKVSELLPPEHKATAGRLRRQRIPSGVRTKSFCLACGQAGHYQKTCPRPSTKVRWETIKTKLTLGHNVIISIFSFKLIRCIDARFIFSATKWQRKVLHRYRTRYC